MRVGSALKQGRSAALSGPGTTGGVALDASTGVGQARILVVDNDPQRTLVLARLLADEGYLVEVAHDAAAGWPGHGGAAPP